MRRAIKATSARVRLSNQAIAGPVSCPAASSDKAVSAMLANAMPATRSGLATWSRAARIASTLLRHRLSPAYSAHSGCG
jgi:hypothetical protein